MPRYELDSDKNKWIEAVGKLITLTQEGRLLWRTQPPPPDLVSNSPVTRVDVVYMVDYRNKTVRLYENLHGAQLELVEPNSNAVWRFPSTGAISHLLTAVRYQVTGVKRFLDELLAEAV